MAVDRAQDGRPFVLLFPIEADWLIDQSIVSISLLLLHQTDNSSEPNIYFKDLQNGAFRLGKKKKKHV